MPEKGVQLSVLPGGDPQRGSITVVGMLGDSFELLGRDAQRALHNAAAVAGGRRHIEAWRSWSQRQPGREGRTKPIPVIEMGGDADAFAHQIAQRAVEQTQRVCVLASGDPGFFGVVRSLLSVVDRSTIEVLPSPSSVSVAFARLGLPWDDAVVVSAHGRPLEDAVRVLRLARKAAVLTSPDSPPQALGRALADNGLSMDLVAVCSRLGYSDETVQEISLEELSRGTWDPLSVVVLVGPGRLQPVGWSPGSMRSSSAPTLAWGLPDEVFAHRDGMVTKAELRAIVLGKLALPPAGVLWDVGAGSGSVAVECARLCPGLTVFAIEEREDDAARISANAASLDAPVHVVSSHAPEALQVLPDPDRAFVGGGGVEILDAVLKRLRPGGQVVATYAAMDRAAAAAGRLGAMAQISVSSGARLPDGGWRLEARNPVFVVWGPEESSSDATPEQSRSS